MDMDLRKQSDRPESLEGKETSEEMLRTKVENFLKRGDESQGEHQITLTELYKRLELADPEMGLTIEQAAENLVKYGYNELTLPKTTVEWEKFMKTGNTGFSLLLWLGAVLCLIAYEIYLVEVGGMKKGNLLLCFIVMLLVIITSIFKYYQKSQSSSIMGSFKNLVPEHAVVVRNGEVLNIDAREVVRGDIVKVKFGDIIPADIRIIQAHGFKVDNSSLTGKSEPQSRIPEYTHPMQLKTKNMAFLSTSAVEGTATGVVIHTGKKSVMGRIAGLASGQEAGEKPFVKAISYFIDLLPCAGVFFGTVAFILADNWIKAIVFLIGIIVANAPKGPLATVTNFWKILKVATGGEADTIAYNCSMAGKYLGAMYRIYILDMVSGNGPSRLQVEQNLKAFDALRKHDQRAMMARAYYKGLTEHVDSLSTERNKPEDAGEKRGPDDSP